MNPLNANVATSPLPTPPRKAEMTSKIRRLAWGLAATLLMAAAHADEAVIRKNIAQRLPDFPKIDEVSKAPLPGLWEVRVGTDLYYSDAEGAYLIEGGSIIDIRNRTNLTQQRVLKLTAIRFDELPLKDAMVIKQGNGSRKLAVFGDPNCGYCKRLERDLATLKDVTIYTFLYPVLGPDSDTKSRAIWCSKDSMANWRRWMLDGAAPPRTMGECDTAAIERNVAFGRKYRINGTPALVFEDGQRVPGAMPLQEIEKRMAEARRPRG
jgi:thiol:disulfide interchange protein DsbC